MHILTRKALLARGSMLSNCLKLRRTAEVKQSDGTRIEEQQQRNATGHAESSIIRIPCLDLIFLALINFKVRLQGVNDDIVKLKSDIRKNRFPIFGDINIRLQFQNVTNEALNILLEIDRGRDDTLKMLTPSDSALWFVVTSL